MLLVIDVGNTHTVIGIYEDKNLIGHWRISTDLKKTEDELAMLFINLLNQKGLSYNNIKAIAISCVVPPLTWTLNKMAKNYFQVRPIW
ncbi:MAG: type III pantothenate kinase [Atribacterota bacterium]|nr:type III pantothenate kinase [Atribacterota bacterium]